MDTTAHVNGDAGGPAAAESSASYDPTIFRKYLLALLPPLIGADLADLHTLFDDEFDERVSRFANESGGVIYVVKAKEESDGACCAGQQWMRAEMACRRVAADVFVPAHASSHIPSLPPHHSCSY